MLYGIFVVNTLVVHCHVYNPFEEEKIMTHRKNLIKMAFVHQLARIGLRLLTIPK